ncbi:MAG: F0F1 ATP synthase subunit B [Acidimicrobiales bacterium]
MESSIFIVPNGTFFAELVAFVVILGVVAKYLMPRLNSALEARQDAIRSQLAAADEAKAEAEADEVKRRAALEEARVRAREIVEQAQHTAERLSADAHARGEQEYERLLTSAEEQVAVARQRALEQAAQRLGEVVVDVVERIIGREMDAAAHADLIDAAVSALSAEPDVAET